MKSVFLGIKGKKRSTFTENICDEFLRNNRFLISASDGIGFFFSRFDSQPNVTSFLIIVCEKSFCRQKCW